MLWFVCIQSALALNDGGLQLWLSDSIDLLQYFITINIATIAIVLMHF